jgi:hypothetical protein
MGKNGTQSLKPCFKAVATYGQREITIEASGFWIDQQVL